MKVLITGTKGQLVQGLREQAAGRPGFELVTLGRSELNLEVPGSAAEAIRIVAPDVVINASAYTDVDGAEREPERAFRVNAEGAAEAAAAARDAGAFFIQISTDYVFDGEAEVPYREDAPTRPLGVYGHSKLAGEQQVRAATPDHLILRTAWLYSPFGRNFVKTMMQAGKERPVVDVKEGNRGSPTSALDLADGILAVLERRALGEATGRGEIYHLAGSGETSWRGLAEHVMAERRALGLPAAEVKPIGKRESPARALRPRNSVLDSSKFARDFGFVMRRWEQSVAAVVRRIAGLGSILLMMLTVEV